MKYLYQSLIACLFVAMAAGCDDLFDLDLRDNPNTATPDQAEVAFLFNNIQLEFKDIYNNMQVLSSDLVRHTSIVRGQVYNYSSGWPATAGNAIWLNTYGDFLPDVRALSGIAADRGLDIHAAIVQILEAYVMMGIVDFFGSAPYSQALQGTDVISPPADDGPSIYAAAENLLDQAIATLQATTAVSPGAGDLYYAGNKDRWITLAKTLKLRVGVTTRLAGGAGKIMPIVNGGDFIQAANQDFQFTYHSNRTNPDSRHPFYPNQYESADGAYMGNYFMWLLAEEKEMRDPRIRFYFNRQTPDSFAHPTITYSCHLSERPECCTPPHYLAVDPNMPYCVAAEDGYYGRDHLNGEGIPPDGPVRAVYGLFPGGGKWDNNQFINSKTQGTQGAMGAGINPILTSYIVDFMRAEAALTAGTGEDARALLESGVRKSIAKVRSFESKITATERSRIAVTAPVELTAEEAYLDPLDDQVEDYVALVLDRYDNAADKLDVVMKEYYISLAGNAYEAYNMYRRTGKPNNMQPEISQGAAGSFPRSLFFPQDHVVLNASVSQKPNLSVLVFWDDGSANVY